jgi:cell division transport system permease protein
MPPSAIISAKAQPMRTLTLAMAVMCYLATLALGALMLIEAAVSQWVSGMASEATVQVRQLSDSDLDAEMQKALAILTSTPGISGARALGPEDVNALLEPWLGASPAVAELPLPRLISVSLDAQAPPDLLGLEKRLAADVKGASLDTHLLWQSQFTRAASTLRRLSLGILALIALSATALVIFATRSVLDANRGVIEVLHLVGADDGFIARAVKARFLRSSFIAGLAGTFGGLLTFAALGLVGERGDAGLSAATADLLMAAPSVAAATYAVFLIVPVAATLLSMVTAHLAVLRQLQDA